MKDAARPPFALLFSASACLAFGCVGTEAERPAVFGGEGAVVEAPKEQALPASSEAPVAGGPCAEPKTAGDVALLDDFEDGDQKVFKAFQREGWWFSATDPTAGATLQPSGEFRAEKLPEAEATPTNGFAAHLVASGQKEWGATWGATLRWVDQGVRCPYNASTFTGVKFRAKGQGTIRLVLGQPLTMPSESGGTCTEKCYDTHGKVIFLTERWEEHVVPWDRVQQEGWGTDARFDPARLIQVGFKVDIKHLPVDFWIDDIEFVKK
jgi:hypothetical protein